jgi:hypothetical protein
MILRARGLQTEECLLFRLKAGDSCSIPCIGMDPVRLHQAKFELTVSGFVTIMFAGNLMER